MTRRRNHGMTSSMLSSRSSREPGPTDASIRVVGSGSGLTSRGTSDANPDAHPRRMRGMYPTTGWAHEMLCADPQVYRGSEMQELTIASLAWDIVPPPSPTPDEQAQTEHIRSSYRSVAGGFVGAAIVRPLSARLYGFSLSEITADIDEKTGLWGLTGLHWIAPWTVRAWITDDAGYCTSVLIRDERGEREIPWDKLLYLGQRHYGRNFEGIPVVRPIRYYWEHKSDILVGDATARDRASSGIPYAEPPPDRDRETHPAEFQSAESIVANLLQDRDADENPAYYVAPASGWKIGVNYLDSPPDVTGMLTYIDHQIASQMADTITHLGSTDTGSRAVGVEMRLERWGMLSGMCAIMASNLDQQVHGMIYSLNGWDTSRMCRTVASGLQDQMFYRRILEYATAERPADPLFDLSEEAKSQLYRTLGLAGA